MANKKTTKYRNLIRRLKKFHNIGNVWANKLADRFGTFKAIQAATQQEIIDFMGERAGDNFFVQLHPEDNADFNKVGAKGKYSTKVGEAVAEDYQSGNGTIEEVCNRHEISVTTFFRWKQEIPEFWELIKTADKIRREEKKALAMEGMRKLLTGYEAVETSTLTKSRKGKNGQTENVPIQTTINRKHVAPSAAMVIFTLVNTTKDDDEPMKHVQHIKYEGGSNLPPIDLSKFTEEELLAWEKLMQKAQAAKE